MTAVFREDDGKTGFEHVLMVKYVALEINSVGSLKRFQIFRDGNQRDSKSKYL